MELYDCDLQKSAHYFRDRRALAGDHTRLDSGDLEGTTRSLAADAPAQQQASRENDESAVDSLLQTAPEK